MRRFRCQQLVCITAILIAVSVVRSQRTPYIGYVYPAGGQQGTTLELAIAGQYLDGINAVDISGSGVEASVVEHIKPLNGKEINLLRDQLKELQKMMADSKQADSKNLSQDSETDTPSKIDREAIQKEITDIRGKLANPKNRNRDNRQLSEDVVLRIKLAPDAEPGTRELRLKASFGLSNPLLFYVGKLPEFSEKEPNETTKETEMISASPVVINGQILPGDVDCFRLRFNKGMRLVVKASARELIPYLADAVPGWFQATLAIYDADGQELAYADDYRYQPDPVLLCEIPKDGEYVLEIKDAIYRGREDFVYRITLGEMPFITSIFPLGGRVGTSTTVEVQGWNLPANTLTFTPTKQEPDIQSVVLRKGALESNRLPFAVDTFPECLEQKSNQKEERAQKITLPVTLNGRIDSPGDKDRFCFEGKEGQEIVAEVYARRLASPLDSILTLTDSNGKELLVNDDHEDKGTGLLTHHADSLLQVKLPADGIYTLCLRDSQYKGGSAYAYRLRVSSPRPDFDLRIVPSSINARPGTSVPITVYALRKDGFSDAINVMIKDAPNGFQLTNGRIPASQEQAILRLKVPRTPTKEPICLSLEGQAKIQDKTIVRSAVPADDRMQAFIYRHLVPAQELKVAVIRPANARAPAQNPPAKNTKLTTATQTKSK
ncbi:MAG: hypothetical protein JXA82_12890 [Sedimentisphaerales bacterium]|nr:hypothetical protein [Sedimentisphaerales bacterium]